MSGSTIAEDGWWTGRKAQELFGGAVIMFDEDLNALSLRMYNESTRASDYTVKFAAIGPTPSSPSPFLEKIQSMVRPGSPPWSDFSRAVADAVVVHTHKLAEIVSRS